MIITLEQANFLALVVMVVALVPSTYRVLYGPTLPDRIAASDAVGNVLAMIFALYAFQGNSIFLMDVAMLLSIISFVGTVIVAKYLDTGEVL
ncbi:Na(+) H(+) antiporter subunit F [Methanosarcina horonobensis HB-1 = JCM 15518]|uniref:Na(+) H(+) antiporter subunit F n=1 Tax=Methanosarcina horonobensis HB-1 = JCM 15518 TaxID=1434110 RepID=A0A0E3SA74_9EURY|nr:cation:proton antiporter [Methanosarcina horonobensis]AKB76552.1 Na(+) H(+) antiporter subunit F [Methanosarcina horonobensis HB-1 = JCM 15518]